MFFLSFMFLLCFYLLAMFLNVEYSCDCVHTLLSHLLQSGASSRAKHGGAYFSAVRGSVKDPIAVPGRHEVPGV